MPVQYYIEDNYAEALISRAAVIYKTSTIHLTIDKETQRVTSDVSDGKIYNVEIDNPLSFKQSANCQCNQFLEIGHACRHVVATLMSYRDQIFDEQSIKTDFKPIQEKSIKRLNITDILDNVSKDELISFVHAYAREDKKLSTALKVHFARILESEHKADKYKSILNSILPPVSNKSRKFGIADLRSLAKVLDDFYGQMQDCLALKEYLEASYILEASLFKVSYVLHFAHQQYDVLVGLSVRFHEAINDFAREKISPALMQSLKKMLFDLSNTSYYEIFQPKANAFHNLMELAKISERAHFYNHAIDSYQRSNNTTQKEFLFVTIWLFTPSKQYKVWLESIKENKLSAITITKHLQEIKKGNKAQELLSLYITKQGFDKDIALKLIELLSIENNLPNLIKHILFCLETTKDYVWVTRAKKMMDNNRFLDLYGTVDEWIKNHQANVSSEFIKSHLRCSENTDLMMDDIARNLFDIESIHAYEDIIYFSDSKTVANLYIYHIDDYLDNHIGIATAAYMKDLRLHINKTGMRDIIIPIVKHLSIKYSDRPYLAEAFGIL
jgi:hypothetical protein